mmetsp:Transcript_39708/g.120243  ORF Transcript_39708/g.120243 Transcript_39708/m.120243 type:complete len:139 (+) Transcript_39708:202-618(+)
MWVVLILFFVLWAAAACTKVVLGESPAWNGSMDPLVEHEPFSSFDNQEYFGSVSRSFLTLLQLMTFAQWAEHVARQVQTVYPVLSIFFGFLSLATSFGLIMGVISNIVQDAIAAARVVEKVEKQVARDVRRAAASRAT